MMKRILGSLFVALFPVIGIIAMNIDFGNWPAFGWVMMVYGAVIFWFISYYLFPWDV